MLLVLLLAAAVVVDFFLPVCLLKCCVRELDFAVMLSCTNQEAAIEMKCAVDAEEMK